MKIADITCEAIVFDNGKEITYTHYQDCCEKNYADFEQLDDIALATDFDEDLIFEVNDSGFRFGNPNKMFFVPCYSVQNGFYTKDIEIWYDGKKQVELEAEWVDS